MSQKSNFYLVTVTILTIPVLLILYGIVIGLIFAGAAFIFSWFLIINPLISFVIFIFTGFLIWGLFHGVSALLIYKISKICPTRWVPPLLVTIISIACCVLLIISIWDLSYDFNGWQFFIAILCTLFSIKLTADLVIISYVERPAEKLNL